MQAILLLLLSTSYSIFVFKNLVNFNFYIFLFAFFTDLFSAPIKNEPKKTLQDANQKKPSKTKTLFDDDNDDDDDLFSSSVSGNKQGRLLLSSFQIRIMIKDVVIYNLTLLIFFLYI